jgi:hypothetical protein
MEGRVRDESFARFQGAAKSSEEAAGDVKNAQLRQADITLRKVKTERFEFRFQNISVHTAGRDGKNIRGVGWRYGVPHFDRKRGQVKIPTQVPETHKLN